MPLHYALSDGLVGVLGMWGLWTLAPRGQLLAGLGLGLFGLAGLIGVVRITSGLIEPMALLHKSVSQLGGLAGLILILSGLVRHLGLKVPAFGVLAAAAVAVVIAVRMPAVGQGLFAAGLLAGIVVLAVAPGAMSLRVQSALAFGLMLPNVLLLRSAPALNPDLRWHAYHLIVALWLVLLPFCLSERVKTTPEPA
ncbi:MAG: hypothetical protein RLZZ141_1003 [Pseudomonadota bacterium]